MRARGVRAPTRRSLGPDPGRGLGWLLALAVAGWTAAPLPAQVVGGDEPRGGTALDGYVAAGLSANLDLVGERIRARQSFEEWNAARGAHRPSLALDARYSMAEGGRSFEIPIGDLMNPVYGALNGLIDPGGEGPFAPIANQRINFLREREQETRLRVSQVIWNPGLRGEIRARDWTARAARSGVEALERSVVRDVKVAYYRYVNAARAVEILVDALDLVVENERVRRGLVQASLATYDDVERARAERLAVEQDAARAAADAELARTWLNYLLDRDADTPVAIDARDLELPSGGLLRRASSAGDEVDWIEELRAGAAERRPELAQLDHALAAAEAGVDAARGSRLPSLAVAIDAGIQGTEYGIGREDRYVMGSLLLQWSLTDGGSERARQRRAALDRDRISARRRQVERQIRMEVESAALDLRVAVAGVARARQRVQAASASFRLVARRQDEGLATPLEFLDARAAMTEARLSASILETEALIGLAELEFTAGTESVSTSGRTDTESDR